MPPLLAYPILLLSTLISHCNCCSLNHIVSERCLFQFSSSQGHPFLFPWQWLQPVSDSSWKVSQCSFVFSSDVLIFSAAFGFKLIFAVFICLAMQRSAALYPLVSWAADHFLSWYGWDQSGVLFCHLVNHLFVCLWRNRVLARTRADTKHNSVSLSCHFG